MTRIRGRCIDSEPVGGLMITERVFLIFSFLYLVAIGIESLLFFLSHQEKKTLIMRVRHSQRSYRRRMHSYIAKMEEAIREREEKIRQLEEQLVRLKNDREKRMLQETIARLKNEVEMLQREVETLKRREAEEGGATIDPEEFFQLKERNIELEMQVVELKQLLEEQALQQQQRLAEGEKEMEALQLALNEKMVEIAQLKEERDLLQRECASLKKEAIS
ncbi:MAG: hypothetical protein D6736_07805 [Nitrospinota bacterium]|nr:MAG: hypothetical protein D6736_07805 [Nitrospinota bacterium]